MTYTTSLIDEKSRHTMIMRTGSHFYPVQASGAKPLQEEAADHGSLNHHVKCIEDIHGNVLWSRQ